MSVAQPAPPPLSGQRSQLRGGAFDAAAVARAEAALQGLSSQFGGWMRDEVEKLDAARSQSRGQSLSAEAGERLYSRAHDMKGLGGTYQFPIVTRIAASLCRLLEPERRAAAPAKLIDAHVDAIKAVVRDDVRTDEDPVGRILVGALEGEVRAYAMTADRGSTTAP